MLKKMQTLQLILIVATLTAIWCQGCGETTNGRRGIFNLLGKGFHQVQSDCFSGQLSHPVLGTRKRVARIPMASTRGNPQLFCNQNAYVPFGARCNDELPDIDSVNVVAFETETQLQEFLGQFSNLNPEWSTVYCQENLQRKQLSLTLQDSLRNGRILIAEFVVIQTHSSLTEQFCDAELTGDFLQSVRNLPAQAVTPSDRRMYDEFIRDYGISVVNQVKLGGLAIKFSSAPYNYVQRTIQQFASDVNVTYYGGDSAAIRDSNRKYGLWMETVFDHPTFLAVGAVKITELFNPDLFSTDDVTPLIIAKAQIIDGLIDQQIPGDFELMFSDGSTRKYLIGQYAQAPETQSIVNIRLLNRDIFHIIQQVGFWKYTPNYQIEYTDLGNPEFIDSILGEWLDQDTENRDAISNFQFKQRNSDTENILTMTIDSTENNIMIDYDLDDYTFRFYDNANVAMVDIKLDFIDNTPALPISNYDIKVRWNDFKVTYHKFNDVIARQSILNSQTYYITDLVILRDKPSLRGIYMENDQYDYSYQNYGQLDNHFLVDDFLSDGGYPLTTIELEYETGEHVFDIQFYQGTSTYQSEKNVYNDEGGIFDGYEIYNGDGFSSIKIYYYIPTSN